MRNLIVINHVTLDGVMQAPGGPQEDPSNGFTHGGWAMPTGDEDSDGRAIDELIARKFELLLGRRTYDIWAGYWPQHGDNPVGEIFNRVTKYVATHRPDSLDWEHSQPLGGDVAAAVRELKASAGPELHLWGSSNLLQTLIAADLVDEYRLWVFPVVLGQGKRLFENGVPPRKLTLVESRATSGGVLLNTYRPAGDSGKL
jgi:dihydrofolate reductase